MPLSEQRDFYFKSYIFFKGILHLYSISLKCTLVLKIACLPVVSFPELKSLYPAYLQQPFSNRNFKIIEKDRKKNHLTIDIYTHPENREGKDW